MTHSVPADWPERTAETLHQRDDMPANDVPLSSVNLLQGHSSIAIDHLGTRYVLRATRAGKLILTK